MKIKEDLWHFLMNTQTSNLERRNLVDVSSLRTTKKARALWSRGRSGDFPDSPLKLAYFFTS